jgi:hypothetical protein
MIKTTRQVLELTVEDIKEEVFKHFMTSFDDLCSRRDIIYEGFKGLNEWTTEALLGYFEDVELCQKVREDNVAPDALVLCRLDHKIVDLSTGTDNGILKLKAVQSKTVPAPILAAQPKCDCGSGQVCIKCDSYNTEAFMKMPISAFSTQKPVEPKKDDIDLDEVPF